MCFKLVLQSCVFEYNFPWYQITTINWNCHLLDTRLKRNVAGISESMFRHVGWGDITKAPLAHLWVRNITVRSFWFPRIKEEARGWETGNTNGRVQCPGCGSSPWYYILVIGQHDSRSSPVSCSLSDLQLVALVSVCQIFGVLAST